LPANDIIVPNLDRNRYRVELVMANRRLGVVGTTVQMNGSNQIHKYELVGRHGRYTLIPAGVEMKPMRRHARAVPNRRGGPAYNQVGIHNTRFRTPAPQFDHFLSAIHRQAFDRDKVAMATQYLNTHRVSSSQVTRLVNAMSFESSKVDVAMAAYQSTIDPQNYDMVYNAFAFSSSARKLDQFIYGSGAQCGTNHRRW
jgi:hypothetical protein